MLRLSGSLSVPSGDSAPTTVGCIASLTRFHSHHPSSGSFMLTVGKTDIADA
jgi:hypothetical protein